MTLDRYSALAALVLGFSFAASAADELVPVPGDRSCRNDTAAITLDEGRTYRTTICNRINAWDIVRIGERGSVSGTGYGCVVTADDTRALGATICRKLPPPKPPPPPKAPTLGAGYKCKTPGCDVAEPRFAAGSWGVHNCSGLMTAQLRTHCEERNQKIPAVLAKCEPLKGKKAYNACLWENDPKPLNTFNFSDVDFSNCQGSLPVTCRNQVPDWMVYLAGNQGQVTSCEQEPRSAACIHNMRLYKLCGERIFSSQYYVEECLIRARK